MDMYYFPVFSYKRSEAHYHTYIKSTRIQKITLSNFKGVRHGEIELNNLKSLDSSFNSSNILGLYGQNGSGKSTLIEALYVLKTLMSGNLLPPVTADFISQDSDSASMQVVFERKAKDSDEVEFLTYSFSIKRKTPEEIAESGNDSTVTVYDELITSSTRDINGKLIRKTHKLYDSNSKDSEVNCSEVSIDVVTSAYSSLVNDDSAPTADIIGSFADNSDCWSFDCTKDQAKYINAGGSGLFYEGGPTDDYLYHFDYYDEVDGVEWRYDDELSGNSFDKWETLRDLQYYAKYHLFVAGANLFRAFDDDVAPIYLQGGYIKTHANTPSMIDAFEYRGLEISLTRLNTVLDCIVPGLHITTSEKPVPWEEYRKTTYADKEWISAEEEQEYKSEYEQEPDRYVSFCTERKGTKILLKNESEGIKRIIYTLDLLIAAYNNPGITVAIDEFDAGIFEYLLGELLKIFETSGSGQLIFTSHNLRPLEVISRKFICFTTTNPENRYIRLKYIGNTNNLRDVYFRQILLGEQDEEIYNATKQYKLKAAFETAGDLI